MVILIGLICLAIGISLAVNQWAAWLVTLQVLVSLGLLFWGAIFVLVGYSEMKARRDYAKAVNPDDVPCDDTPQSGTSSGSSEVAQTPANPTI